MRVTQLAFCALAVVAAFAHSLPMADAASTHDTKIAAKLLTAVHADPQVEANIMVQLESPEQVMRRVCDDGANAAAPLSRAQKTTCMVDNMQQFADESQQEVKDLLARHAGEFSDSTFFWINNSVSVKKAKGSLVLALSALDTVLEIRPEQIFHTMASGGGGQTGQHHEQEKETTIGFGMLN